MVNKMFRLCILTTLLFYNCSTEPEHSEEIKGLENVPYELLYGKLAFSYDPVLGDYIIINAESKNINIIKWKREYYFRYRTLLSPTGNKIVFEGSDAFNGIAYTQIFTLNTDGSNLKQLTFYNTDNLRHTRPVWSSDANQIFYMKGTHSGQIYSCDTLGNNILRITDFSVDGGFSVSENSNLIAFSKIENTEESWVENIFLYNRQDSTFKKLTSNEESFSAVKPVLSPDTQKIAFLLTHGPNEFPQNTPPYFSEIVVVNTNGTGRRTLIDFSTYIEETDSYSFCWSPNGEQLAFSKTDDTGSNIYIVNFDDGDIIQITNGDSFFSPTWIY